MIFQQIFIFKFFLTCFTWICLIWHGMDYICLFNLVTDDNILSHMSHWWNLTLLCTFWKCVFKSNWTVNPFSHTSQEYIAILFAAWILFIWNSNLRLVQNSFEQISHCALFGHPWVLALCIFRFLSIINPFLQMLHSKHSSIVLGKKILCIFNITFLRRSGCVEFFLFTKYPLKSVWNWLMGIHFFVFIHYYFQPFQPSFLKI